MSKLLRRALGGKDRQPAALITGVIGPAEKNGGWSVSWAGDGAWPPIPGAELQLAIYPWNYRGGPMFDIDGHPGSFTAHDIQGSDLTVYGATLEDLASAVEHMPDIPADDSMFRWIRQITSLHGTSP
jgi:hypothetical protein